MVKAMKAAAMKAMKIVNTKAKKAAAPMKAMKVVKRVQGDRAQGVLADLGKYGIAKFAESLR